MSKRKVAPATVEVVEFLGRGAGRWMGGQTDMALVRELRALLAVARAAERCARDYEEEPYGIHRALARLRRAGKAGAR